MEHKGSGAGGSGSDSELNKRTPEGSRLSGDSLCCTNRTVPTGALDSKTSRDVLGFLKQLNGEGNTIVMITHDNTIAMEARRVVRIKDGQINFDGDVKDYAAII